MVKMHGPTTNLPLVRLSSVNPFLLDLSRRQLDGGAILRKMGLPGQVPASADLFASALAVYEIVEECAVTADDPYMGYRIGRDMDITQWEPIAQSVRDADTVSDLLRNFVVNSLVHSSSTNFFIKTEGERSTFGFTRKVVPTFQPGQNDAFYLGFLGSLLEKATESSWDPTQVFATISNPELIPAPGRGIRVAQGEHDGVAISFPTSWQFSQLKKSAFKVNDKSVDAARVPHTLLDSVHLALFPHLHETDLNVERAAKICGYSKRQLSRKLREQGTTIFGEVASLRAQHASEKLTESNTKIASIGESVGFKDPTVFSRAFKSWTGQSPQEYRRNTKL
jgi:AraC-like DNA-binding protein